MSIELLGPEPQDDDARDAARLDWLEEAYARGAVQRDEWANFMTHVAEVGYRRAIDQAMKADEKYDAAAHAAAYPGY